MRRIFAVFFAAAITLMFASCGGGESVGSSVSVDITSPESTTDVPVTTQIIATITDTEGVGITQPANWGDVFTLREVGSDTNICTGYTVTTETITCLTELSYATQYALTVSGLTDANGNRIDPSSLAFQTVLPY